MNKSVEVVELVSQEELTTNGVAINKHVKSYPKMYNAEKIIQLLTEQGTYYDTHNAGTIEVAEGAILLANGYLCCGIPSARIGFCLNPFYISEDGSRVELSRMSVAGVVELNMANGDFHRALENYNTDCKSYNAEYCDGLSKLAVKYWKFS